jgi:hypothetical protein
MSNLIFFARGLDIVPIKAAWDFDPVYQPGPERQHGLCNLTYRLAVDRAPEALPE